MITKLCLICFLKSVSRVAFPEVHVGNDDAPFLPLIFVETSQRV